MENQLKVFTNSEFGSVRTVEVNGVPYFVGRDVATILAYAKPENAIATHVDGDDTLKQGIIDSLGRTQQTTLINESGLYSLVFGSKLPNAKKFTKWVTSEVLPSIRKTGSYNVPQMSVNELIFEMAKSNLETEKRINALEVKQQAIEERTEKVLDVFSMPTNITWHEAITSEFKKICYKNNLNYQVVLGDLYKELESEVGCDLTARQRNKQKRMKTAGCTAKQIKHDTSKIMLIEDDDALRLAFENIFRKFQVRYIQGNNVQEYI